MSNPQRNTSIRLLKDILNKLDESTDLNINIDLLEKLYDEFENRTYYPDKNAVIAIERILDNHNGNKSNNT